MAQAKSSRRGYWILFAISFTIMVGMLMFPSSSNWFWVALPFAGTFLVQALDRF